MNENCVAGKKGAFIACGTATLSRWWSLFIAAERRRTRVGVAGGATFSLARTSGIAVTSPAIWRFSWPAPHFSWNNSCFQPSRLLGPLDARVPSSGHVHLGNHFQLLENHDCPWCLLVFLQRKAEAKWEGKKYCYHSFLHERISSPLAVSNVSSVSLGHRLRWKTVCTVNPISPVTCGLFRAVASLKALSSKAHLLMGMPPRLSSSSPSPLQRLIFEEQFKTCCSKVKVIFC